MDDKKLIKPEYLSSSIGSVMKYTFDTFEELEKFFSHQPPHEIYTVECSSKFLNLSLLAENS